MRSILAFILVLGLIIEGVKSQSTSNTNTNSNTLTPSNSLTPSISVSNSNSISVSNSNTNSVSSSVTRTVTNTVTNSGTETGTQSVTATVTIPQPPGVVNVINACPGHIENICPSWEDPTGFTFDTYKVYYEAAGATTFKVVTVTQTSTRISNLTGDTTYTFEISGVDSSVGVYSLNTTATFTTDPDDPKADPALDATDFTCVAGVNANNNRVDAVCSWTAPDPPTGDSVTHINLKAHCVSSTTKPLLIRKKLFGTKADVTSVTFAINRADTTCNFYARFYYVRRPTVRKHFQLVIGSG